ncbi:MAG: carboxymuconolactone decarboxylase family protein [Anaerolineales bacterium]
MTAKPKTYQQFQSAYPEVYSAYERLGEKIAESGPLDQKTRELIKLGMAAGRQAESSVHSHVHRALEAGATPAEIEHAVLLGITTLGFPATMAALSWTKEALSGR